MDHLVHLTPKSKNAKTGPIPVSTTSAKTCPSSCPFNNANAGGCYAAGGPLAMHWRKVTSGERGDSWGDFCAKIEALPEGQVWRHNQAGDLPGDGLEIDGLALSELIQANRGKRGFTYTHYPVAGDSHVEATNRHMIERANKGGFRVNLSANNLAHADALAELDIAPIVAVLPADQTTNTRTPKGRKVVVCPATQRDDVSCASCQMCQRSNHAIVGFPAHGAAKRKASRIASE